MKKFFRAILFFATVLFSAISAQDSLRNYQLNEIVKTANKIESNINDVSTKVELINSTQIKRSNGNRLPEILKNSSLVYIKSYGLSPSLQTVSVNGLGAEHTLFLIDGVKLNSFQNSQFDLSLIPKNTISRIEIINNGGSSIYGSDAVGGVINIITKSRPKSNSINDFQLSLSAAIGSYNTDRYSLNVYKQFNGFDINVSYSKEKSNGDFEYYFDNGISKVKTNRIGAEYFVHDAGINTQYFINNFNRIRFISNISSQDKNQPGQATGVTPPNTKQIDKNWNNILIVENTFSSDVRLKSSINFQNNLMKYDVKPIQNNYHKNLVLAGASELNWKTKFTTITTGYNFAHATLKSSSIFERVKRNQHALFVSSAIPLFEILKIYPSARYDYISDIDKSSTTYKLGINLQPIKNISLKGNVGKNFRAPTFNDLYWINAGNENLLPEKSINAEAGILYSFNSIISGRIELTYTLIETKDKIVWTPTGGMIWRPFNITESISKIVSLSSSIAKNINEDFAVRINAGFQITNSKKTSSLYNGDPTTDKHVPFLPLETAKINLSCRYKKIEINLFGSYTGKRYSDFINKKELKSYNTIDGNINFSTTIWNVESNLKLETNNIFNTEYETIPGYPMPLRNFLITISVNY